MALASSSTASACLDRGTRWARAFRPFMRSPGIVHIAESRFISSHRAPLASVERTAVSAVNLMTRRDAIMMLWAEATSLSIAAISVWSM